MSTFIMYFVSAMSSISIGTQSSVHHKLPHPSIMFFYHFFISYLVPLATFLPILLFISSFPFPSIFIYLVPALSFLPFFVHIFIFLSFPSFPHFSHFSFPSRFSHPYLLPLLFSPFTISFFLPFFPVIKHFSFCYFIVNLSFSQY